jgi:hypothetical protein
MVKDVHRVFAESHLPTPNPALPHKGEGFSFRWRMPLL